MKFSWAVGLAVLMVLIAAVDHKISAGYFALVLLYLVLASLAPWLMVPIGAVILIGEVFLFNSGVGAWLGSFASTTSGETTANPGQGAGA